ncbi:Oidioi.mRNA.OKI2018_I69.chr1.g3728.t1.cds [Oikopleura dioica]|uniref:Oidioi.mRNA.OKI2018_I69.chr1.g3728.t1.cds n=1 Tax=Oikopleura dioica TaxID=34765 RepID=A0ABN7SZ07_OIKDI|nr:Oidioi.mRNA.OKI2018_I69.chr1.g3728.t1.cds [Oikopleura dioica]
MIKLLIRRKSEKFSLVPKNIFRDRNLPARFRKKDDPVKEIRSEFVALKKHEQLFADTGGMRKLLGTVSLLISSSVGYCLYKTFLFEELEENLSKSEEIALRAAYFKFGTSHLAYLIFLFPGLNCIFPRLCLKIWGVQLLSRAPKKSPVVLLQLYLIVFAALASATSIDPYSIAWIDSLPEEKRQAAESCLIHPASGIYDHLPYIYRVLHAGTLSYKHFQCENGFLDSKVFSFLLDENMKESLRVWIYSKRQVLIGMFGNSKQMSSSEP